MNECPLWVMNGQNPMSASIPIADRTSGEVSSGPNSDIANSIDFRVFFATSMKARSFGADVSIGASVNAAIGFF